AATVKSVNAGHARRVPSPCARMPHDVKASGATVGSAARPAAVAGAVGDGLAVMVGVVEAVGDGVACAVAFCAPWAALAVGVHWPMVRQTLPSALAVAVKVSSLRSTRSHTVFTFSLAT